MAYSHISTSKLSNDQLHCLGTEELVRRLRRCDQDRTKAVKEHSQLMKDFNQRLQVHLLEIRGLKEVNQRLQDDNQELRGLCCFLDDERQKGRTLAGEWQRFGRYTSGVMRSEVSVYQEKLTELEARQEALITENCELKQLCMYLGQDGGYFSSDSRDQGDGDSNSSTDNKPPDAHETSHGPTHARTDQDAPQHEQTLVYVKQLEERISRLEEEKKMMSQRPKSHERMSSPTRKEQRKFFSTPEVPDRKYFQDIHSPRNDDWNPEDPAETSQSKNAKAVANAMKVLEIHEKLERPRQSLQEEDGMTASQKALLRQMCGVVWRKLGDEVPGYKTQV